jgi:hypothetical protein
MPHNPHPKERTPATVQTALAAIGTKKATGLSKLLSTRANQEKISAFQKATTKNIL